MKTLLLADAPWARSHRQSVGLMGIGYNVIAPMAGVAGPDDTYKYGFEMGSVRV